MKKLRIFGFIVIGIFVFLFLYLRTKNTEPAQTATTPDNPKNCQVKECENGQSQIYLEGIGWSPCADRCSKQDLENNGGKKSCDCPQNSESKTCTNICLTFGDPCSTQYDYYQWTGCR